MSRYWYSIFKCPVIGTFTLYFNNQLNCKDQWLKSNFLRVSASLSLVSRHKYFYCAVLKNIFLLLQSYIEIVLSKIFLLQIVREYIQVCIASLWVY